MIVNPLNLKKLIFFKDPFLILILLRRDFLINFKPLLLAQLEQKIEQSKGPEKPV